MGRTGKRKIATIHDIKEIVNNLKPPPVDAHTERILAFMDNPTSGETKTIVANARERERVKVTYKAPRPRPTKKVKDDDPEWTPSSKKKRRKMTPPQLSPIVLERQTPARLGPFETLEDAMKSLDERTKDLDTTDCLESVLRAEQNKKTPKYIPMVPQTLEDANDMARYLASRSVDHTANADAADDAETLEVVSDAEDASPEADVATPNAVVLAPVKIVNTKRRRKSRK